jgi:hypothetical protein
MKVGTVLLILHDVIEKLVGMGLLTAAGDFVGPTVDQDLQIAMVVEEAAKAHGVIFQAEIDKILHALPLVMSFVR